MVAATKTAQTGWLVLLLLVVFFVTRPKLPTGPAPHSPEYLHFLDKLRAETNGQIGDSIKTRTFLIIGGTGYTGGVLVDDLLARGAVDNASALRFDELGEAVVFLPVSFTM